MRTKNTALKYGKPDSEDRAFPRLMTLPTLIVLLVMTAYPLVFTVFYSFTNYQYGKKGGYKIIGLQNYQSLFKSPYFQTAVLNTIKFTILAVLFEMVIGLLIAVFVHSLLRGQKVLRILLLLPYLLPTVTVALSWKMMLSQNYGIDLMGTFNEIQQGFDLINEAQGRVSMMREGAENSNAAENIRENIQFIQETLDENKRKIEELQGKLKSSSINSSKLKEAINSLTQQLNEKNAELETLRAQLAEKDVKIEELTGTVNNLQDENAQVKQQRDETAQIARNQDAQLNTAWYVFGTNKELKAEGILSKGEVLQGNYNKNYFTQIDIRKVNVIPLESKSATLLTNHPAGSYTLLKDSKGEYTLRITDVAKFWSVSKYLVVKVK